MDDSEELMNKSIPSLNSSTPGSLSGLRNREELLDLVMQLNKLLGLEVVSTSQNQSFRKN